MKQALQLKLSQHLTLTPQLQQSIRLLQLSTIELEQEIEQMLADNPLLERDDDTPNYAGAETPATEPLPDSFGPQGGDAPPEWGDKDFGPGHRAARDDEDDNPSERQPSKAITLLEHLTSQLAVMRISDQERLCAAVLAEALDEDGYLTQTLDEIYALLAQQPGLGEEPLLEDPLTHTGHHTLAEDAAENGPGYAIESDTDNDNQDSTARGANGDAKNGAERSPSRHGSPASHDRLAPSDLQVALALLQSCEPAGVGARDLSECLRLQLRALPASPATDLASRIAASHLTALAARDFATLKRACKCEDTELKAARDLILSLNPRPGASFGGTDTRYVMPDVILRKVRNAWRIHVNSAAVPRLKINRLYADILSRERGRSAGGGDNSGLLTQLQEAKWLLKNVQQRFETIERVSQAIVGRQRHFFDHGEVAMRPLVLREIADELGLHESTISRVTTNKYMLTPRGIFELKYFFGSHVATDTGGACSSTAIRALIKQLVTAEEIKKPLSDSKIADILGQQGIVVARRTIAKYREALRIPPANLRKSL